MSAAGNTLSIVSPPCAVSHDIAAHLTGGSAYYGDDADSLARDIAADPSELAVLCETIDALRVEVCSIALASIADRFGAIVAAIKEHAADELDSRLEIRREAAEDDEAGARA